MREGTSVSTTRVRRAPHPQAPLRSAPVRDVVGGDELRLITRDAAIRTGALTGVLIAGNALERQLDVLGTHGIVPSEGHPPLPAALSGFAIRVAMSGRTACEPITSRREPPPAPGSGGPMTHAVGAPVRTPGGAFGALCVEFAATPPDPSTSIWVVESYARLASLCLHDGDALSALLAAARLDALTGCLNHSAIRGELEREIARSARHRRNLSCCFVDLDRFKLVNDCHGHPEGSRVLAEVAAILRAGVRSGDTVGRYGGDEFIVVLPDTDVDAARTLAERLRSLIRSANLTGGHEPLDASIGVAQWRAGTTVAELVSAADDALRAAKVGGGAGVVVFTEDNVASVSH